MTASSAGWFGGSGSEAPAPLHPRCYATLLFRAADQQTMLRKSFALDTLLVRTWVRMLSRVTALPIFVMHDANLNLSSVFEPDLSARIVPWPVEMLIVEPRGTLRWYRHQFTKMHAWALPCQQAAYLDYDGFALQPMDSIFRSCGAAEFCAAADWVTPMKNAHRGKRFNGGVLVLRPNATTHAWLLRAAAAEAQARRARFYYAEQGALNSLFEGRWRRLDDPYNVQATVRAPATTEPHAATARTPLLCVPLMLCAPLLCSRGPRARQPPA